MKLRYDKVSRKVSNNNGVHIKLPPWGETFELENVDSSIVSQLNKLGIYFHYIVDALLERGYIRHHSIFGAPYDFRKGPSRSKMQHQSLKY